MSHSGSRLARLSPCLLSLLAFLLLAPERATAGPQEEPQEQEAPPTVEETVTVTREVDGLTTSLGEGTVGRVELRLRPLQRPGDLLEAVPGLVATQHSGGGKANQYFLRGFNLDHGTDLRVTVDGVPVNMPTHGHGQGYADLAFLIPELVARVDYRKGPHHAADGDFATAGAADFRLLDSLARPLVRAEVGAFGYRRLLAAGSTRLTGGTVLAALEHVGSDGPWVRPDELRKLNGWLRFTGAGALTGLRVTGQAYDGRWNATDQVPARAVASGALHPFGAVDPSDGGESQRFGLNASYERGLGGGLLRAQVWGLRYTLDLYSNFTYFLEDPVDGDQFAQQDRRTVWGGSGSWEAPLRLFGRQGRGRVGLDLRHDDARVGLYPTRARDRLGVVRADRIDQLGGGLWGDVEAALGGGVRVTGGLRAQLYDVAVVSDDARNSGAAFATLLAPMLGVIWRPGDSRTELFANLGRGFHSNDARGVTTRFDPAAGEPTTPADPLVPAWGLDLGARFRGDRFSAAAGVFVVDLDSELVYVGDAGGTEAGPATRRTGVELSGVWRPVDAVEIDAAVGLTRARTRGEQAGQQIPGVVGRVVTAGVATERGPWRGSARLRHLGPRPLDEQGAREVPASTLVNLSASRELLGGARLRLEVFNLFDVQAADIAYLYTSRLPGEPLAGREDVHLHPLVGRQMRLSVGWDF